jgi:hypothetical protein
MTPIVNACAREAAKQLGEEPPKPDPLKDDPEETSRS